MNAIVTLGLSRRFGRTVALRNINLEVPGGGVSALIGGAGSGKTTLLRLLVNLERASAGDAWVMGWNTRELDGAEFHRIGFVPQTERLPLQETTRRHLHHVRGFYPLWDRTLEAALAQWWSIPPDKLIKHLTRGMRLKLAVLAAVAFRPKLLLLDAPFTDLDLPVRREIINGLQRVFAPGEMTILFSAREHSELDAWCGHVALIDAGQLIFAETVETLRARYQRVEVTTAAHAGATAPLPVEWQRFERRSDGCRFIATDSTSTAIAEECRVRFPEAGLMMQPLALSEIIALETARQTKGAAAPTATS